MQFVKKLAILILLIPTIIAASPAELEQTLKNVTSTLQQLQENISDRTRRDNVDDLKNNLYELKQKIIDLDSDIQTDFAKFDDMLRDSTLPDIFWERHVKTVSDYQQRLEELLNQLDKVENTNEVQQLETEINQLLSFLKPLQKPKLQSNFNPDQLAFGIAKPNTRQPFTTKEKFEQSIDSVTKEFTKTRKGRPVEPSYLAETEDVKITDEIKQLARELGFKPVAIFNWVHDNIEFIPSYGSTQGSQMTLDMKRGNAFDTASLLIALLRASNIEARYVYGTVQISPERLIKWLNVADAQAAVDLLAQAAIPNKALISGGEIKMVQFEHIWVDAWIDFVASRGAKHVTGDSWIPLDASFKQHIFTPGIDLSTEVPFDVDGVRDYILENHEINALGGELAVDQTYIKDIIADHQTRLQDYITANNIDPNDSLDSYAIIPNNRSQLAAGLPYQLFAKLDTFAEIPANYRHHLEIKFYHTVSDQRYDNPAVSHKISLPKINSQRFSVTYEPATDADAEALAAVRASGASSLPLHLFRVKPVIKLDDTVLATGTAIGMGQPQYYSFTMQHPHISYSNTAIATAGDVIVFGVNGNGITPELIEKREDRIRKNTAIENMHQVGLTFWMWHDWLDRLAAQVYNVRLQRMPSVGTFSIPLSARYFFGIAREGVYKSRKVDVKHNSQMVVATDEDRFDFMTQSGIHGSYTEGLVLDQFFGRQLQPAISTTQILITASNQNIPIYTITSNNVDEVLPVLQVSAEVKSDIRHAVNNGEKVVIPEREVTSGNWTGSGYIVQDLITGEGAYLLDGGLNGGSWEGCEISIDTVYGMGNVIRRRHERFEKDQTKLIEKLKASRNLSRAAIQGINNALDWNAKNFVAQMMKEPMDSLLISGDGCLAVKAKGPNQSFYTKKPIYATLKKNDVDDKGEVQVDFIGQAITGPCADYKWEFGDGNTDSGFAPSHVYTEEGRYNIKLSAKCYNGDGSSTFKNEIDVYVIDTIGWIDEFPNYSFEYEIADTPNFFLREKDFGDSDYEEIELLYRIMPPDIEVSDVRIKVYEGLGQKYITDDPIAKETLKGATDNFGNFITGEQISVVWTPPNIENSKENASGFYRVQLEVYTKDDKGYNVLLYESSIDDADDDDENGWQCPYDGLAIHDLMWKHRPIVYVHASEKGIPSSIDEFVFASGNSVKEWDKSADVEGFNYKYDSNGVPIDMALYPVLKTYSINNIPDSENIFFDLFEDRINTAYKLWSSYDKKEQNILTTNTGAETVYHSTNTKTDNFIFLQYWMFENYSGSPFFFQNLNGLPINLKVSHEGDMEYVQIAIKLKDEYEPTDKSKWIAPFSATAAQHYYAQTLQWDINNGSASSSSRYQNHVEHNKNRLVIYVALDAHATYFVSDYAIDIPIAFKTIGTQAQYNISNIDLLSYNDPFSKLLELQDWGNTIKIAYDTTAPINTTPIKYKLLHINDSKDSLLSEFKGRWGLPPNIKDHKSGNIKTPEGPPLRASSSEKEPIYLLTMPKQLHNLARKKDNAGDGSHEPQFDKMCIEPCQ